MKLIVGLGNPGKKYDMTRHNVGFRVFQEWSSKDFSWKNKFDSLLARINSDTLVALPQNFMNNSGQTVTQIANFYKINPSDIWIVHDDIDLPLGKLRISQDRSSAGHKGVESIIQSMGTQDLVRFRIGILSDNKEIPTEAYVLQKFGEEEQLEINSAIKKTRQAIEHALANNIESTINKFSS